MSMLEYIEKDRDEWRLSTMKLRARNNRLLAALKKADEFVRLTKPEDDLRRIIREAIDS